MTRAFLTLTAITVAALSAGAQDDPFKIDKAMGNFEGSYLSQDGDSGETKAKIIARGDGDYEGYFILDREGEEEIRLPFRGKRTNGDVEIVGRADLGSDAGGVIEWTGTIVDGEFKGEFSGVESRGTFSLQRVEHRPPTLGAEPPEGAVVLFDGTDLEQWTLADGRPAPWKIVDGAMRVARKEVDGQVVRGSIVSKEKFNDMKIHVEFRTPFMPKATGQARGNSGVYVQERFEVQVLDSFGQPPRDNEAGGIYQASVPKANASLPPGEWQTYDIEFRAPKFEGDQLKEPGEITVVYNGVKIHDKVKLTKPTPGGTGTPPSTPGGILLQDHGDPVEYRNVWVKPLD